MYTKFYDMSSGGSKKLGACTIFIEATKDKAVDLFERIFGRDPCNVTCQCCGSDYSVYETENKPDVGDWVVSKDDIARFESGNKLEHLAI